MPLPKLFQGRGAAWTLVAACTGTIWMLSGDDFSADTTGSFLLPLLHWLFPELHGATLWRLHHFVRKAAHFSEYAALGLLAFRALWLTLESTAQRVAALSLLLALAVAGIDEARQSLSLARTGSIWDVALDLCGAAAAVLLLLLLRRAWQGEIEAESA
jgi:VanZ family protein